MHVLRDNPIDAETCPYKRLLSPLILRVKRMALAAQREGSPTTEFALGRAVVQKRFDEHWRAKTNVPPQDHLVTLSRLFVAAGPAVDVGSPEVID
jgi:hypothetical protein